MVLNHQVIANCPQSPEKNLKKLIFLEGRRIQSDKNTNYRVYSIRIQRHQICPQRSLHAIQPNNQRSNKIDKKTQLQRALNFLFTTKTPKVGAGTSKSRGKPKWHATQIFKSIERTTKDFFLPPKANSSTKKGTIKLTRIGRTTRLKLIQE